MQGSVRRVLEFEIHVTQNFGDHQTSRLPLQLEKLEGLFHWCAVDPRQIQSVQIRYYFP
jgi:hypothetical protein